MKNYSIKILISITDTRGKHQYFSRLLGKIDRNIKLFITSLEHNIKDETASLSIIFSPSRYDVVLDFIREERKNLVRYNHTLEFFIITEDTVLPIPPSNKLPTRNIVERLLKEKEEKK